MAGHRRRRGGLTARQRALINRLNKAAAALAAAAEPSARISVAADALRSVVQDLPPLEAAAVAERAVTALIGCMPADLAASLNATVQSLIQDTVDQRGSR